MTEMYDPCNVCERKKLNGCANCVVNKLAIERSRAESNATRAIRDLREMNILLSQLFSGCYKCKHLEADADAEPCASCQQVGGKYNWEYGG